MSNYIYKAIAWKAGADMGYITGKDSMQMTICAWNCEDLVPQDSPARFIEVFVVHHGKLRD